MTTLTDRELEARMGKMKPHIQRGQPGEDCWICYLDTGRCIGPTGFGDTREEAYDNWRFDLQNNIGPHLDTVDYSKARALTGIDAAPNRLNETSAGRSAGGRK